MADATIQMVSDSIKSFVDKDLVLAHAVMQYDDVDNHFLEAKKDIIGLIGENSDNGESCLDLLMIAKYFERIAIMQLILQNGLNFHLLDNIL